MPLQKNKGQLKKDAKDLNMKVKCHINCASYDAPKEVIVAHLLEKKLLQLQPSLAATQEQSETVKQDNDKR